MRTLLLILLLSTGVRAEWSSPDKLDVALLVANEALVVVDMLQTVGACSDPSNVFCEGGLGVIVMGMHPSPKEVRLWSGAAMLGTAAIWFVLPDPWRKVFSFTLLAGEGLNVANNFRLGYGIRF